jgi:hypothetical protein
MDKPNALAVLRFRINSNLVGNSMGSSAGTAPLKILNRGSLNSTHIRGTLVPVEEPSTASN